MATTKQKRVMHPDVYDTLEFGALAFDGIGAAKDFATDDFGIQYDFNCPVCVWGLAAVAEETDENIPLSIHHYGDTLNNPVGQELLRLGIFRSTNDMAVVAVNTRKHSPDLTGRVPFKPWAKELGIVRGNAEDFPELIETVCEVPTATEGFSVNAQW
jgi:hypothetical protein